VHDSPEQTLFRLSRRVVVWAAQHVLQLVQRTLTRRCILSMSAISAAKGRKQQG